jgi:hypothetical protein
MGRLCRADPRVRWEAVRDLGDHAEEAYGRAPERVSDLLRRLAWLLNDESGATGWGAPEAMGEILARAPDLRPMFAPLFLSWLDDEQVYLGQEVLDAGAIWGIGRMGPGEPFTEDRIGPLLARFLEGGPTLTRGAAAWTAGRLGHGTLAGALERLTDEVEDVTLLLDGQVVDRSVGDLAREALATIT